MPSKTGAAFRAHTGDTTRAAEELGKAVDACRDSTGVSSDMKMVLAKSCLEHGMEAGATEVMVEVMSNASDNKALSKAMRIFEQAGRQDLAESVYEESRRRESQARRLSWRGRADD